MLNADLIVTTDKMIEHVIVADRLECLLFPDDHETEESRLR